MASLPSGLGVWLQTIIRGFKSLTCLFNYFFSRFILMEIYSTLTRSKEDFETINENRVNLFVCGPTVYDDAHIEHGRTYISFDTIKRYLEYKGYAVFYIQNVTDIDDKIINHSKESGIPSDVLARRFEKRYREDMEKLHVNGVNLFARATDHMPEIIDQIQRLIDKVLLMKPRMEFILKSIPLTNSVSYPTGMLKSLNPIVK